MAADAFLERGESAGDSGCVYSLVRLLHMLRWHKQLLLQTPCVNFVWDQPRDQACRKLQMQVHTGCESEGGGS